LFLILGSQPQETRPTNPTGGGGKIFVRGAPRPAVAFVSGFNHRSLACKPDIWRRRKDILTQNRSSAIIFVSGFDHRSLACKPDIWRRRKVLSSIRHLFAEKTRMGSFPPGAGREVPLCTGQKSFPYSSFTAYKSSSTAASLSPSTPHTIWRKCSWLQSSVMTAETPSERAWISC